MQWCGDHQNVKTASHFTGVKELLQKTRIQKANTIAIYCGRMEQGFFSSSLTSDGSQSTTHAHVLRKVPQDSQRGYWIRYTFLIKENHTGRSLWAFWGQGELPRTDQHAQKSKAIQILPSFFVGSPPGDPLAPSWCSLRRRRCCCGTPRPENGLFGGFGSHS